MYLNFFNLNGRIGMKVEPKLLSPYVPIICIHLLFHSCQLANKKALKPIDVEIRIWC